jgi:DNA-directed RNA polymerase specialized sigma24 family protein
MPGALKGLKGKNMLTSQSVKDHLPVLRRYARALTGSQASGDSYVTAASKP